MKDNGFMQLLLENISLENITQFRRLFWNYPEITIAIDELVKSNYLTSSIEALNIFFTEMIRLKVYEDKHLSNLREFRMYIAKKSIGMEE